MATEKPVSSLSSALSEAQNIVEAAKRRASEIDAEAERIRHDARERGRAEGFAEGLREASRAAVRLVSETGTLQEKLASEAARLGVAIAGSIVHEQVKVSPEVVAKIAKRALQESVVGDTVVMIVHPEDQSTLNSIRNDLKKVSGVSNITVESDPEIGRGGCIIRTDFGEVDATLEALVESIAVQLGVKK